MREVGEAQDLTQALRRVGRQADPVAAGQTQQRGRPQRPLQVHVELDLGIPTPPCAHLSPRRNSKEHANLPPPGLQPVQRSSRQPSSYDRRRRDAPSPHRSHS